ncbi:MAG TPA: TraR/DksA C4-type zinc finger protein [Gaiellaceae bacterium]|jgi:RNA polymerase-binding protein DksA|nr:TraR/DksA C4-type zinc finger protein [Gaiellaceae bacterium]
MNTDRYRDELLAERERVSTSIQHLHEEGSLEEETEEETYDNHLADSATATLNREIDYSLEENSGHVLTAIDEALERIESGTFGTCGRCGKPIAEERLDAIPYANRCIDCKRLEERG